MSAVSRGGEPTPQKALDEGASVAEEERDSQARSEGLGEAGGSASALRGETPRDWQRQISTHAWNSICAGPEVSGAVNDTPQEPS